jgi:hypothetical protein
MLVVSLAAAGCTGGELRYSDYHVWNYSSNHYYVRITSNSEQTAGMAVPPATVAYGALIGEPQQAVVYDQTCSSQLATLAFAPQAFEFAIVISAAGAISVAYPPLGSPTSADPSIGLPEPISSGCLALPTAAVVLQPSRSAGADRNGSRAKAEG